MGKLRIQGRFKQMRVISLPDWLPKMRKLFTNLPGISHQDLLLHLHVLKICEATLAGNNK